MIQVILGHDGVRWRKGSTENRLLGGSVPLGQEGACGPLSQTRWRASRPWGPEPSELKAEQSGLILAGAAPLRSVHTPAVS